MCANGSPSPLVSTISACTETPFCTVIVLSMLDAVAVMTGSETTPRENSD